MTFKQRRRKLIVEVARLLKPRTYNVSLWRSSNIQVELRWMSALEVEIEVDPYFGGRGKKILLSDVRSIARKMEAQIEDVCAGCNDLAKDQKIHKGDMWEDILDKAEKRNSR